MGKLLFSMIFCLLSATLNAQTINLFAEDVYYPFSTENGSGLSNDIVKAAYHEVGIDVSFEVMPFTRVLKNLEKGKGLGGFNAIPTTQDKHRYIFTQEPIYTVTTSLYYNAKNDFNAEKVATQPHKYITGEVRGYMYDERYQQLKFDRIITSSDEQLFKMLLKGRLDFAYITNEVVIHLMKKHRVPAGTLKRFNTLAVAKAPLHIAFTRQNPQSNYFAKQFDLGLKRLKLSGKYQHIVKQHLR